MKTDNVSNKLKINQQRNAYSFGYYATGQDIPTGQTNKVILHEILFLSMEQTKSSEDGCPYILSRVLPQSSSESIWQFHSDLVPPPRKFLQFTYKILLVDCQNTVWSVSAPFNTITFRTWDNISSLYTL